MVYYITDGVNYLSNENFKKPKFTKNCETALKFPTEAAAFQHLIGLRSHLSKKAQVKWKIESADKEWTEEKLYCLKCERGYLSSHHSLVSSKDTAGRWTENKIHNVLRNQCSTHPLLKKHVWQIVSEDSDLIELSEPEQSDMDEMEQMIDLSFHPEDNESQECAEDLLPLNGETKITSSMELIKVLSLFYKNITERRIKLAEERLKAEKQIVTIEHAIEFNQYDEKTELKLVAMIRSIRRKRRKCKDELFIINAFLKVMAPGQVDSLVEETGRLEERYYTVKDFPELFTESDHVILSTDSVK